MERIAEGVWCVRDSLWMAGKSIHFDLRTTVWADDRGLVVHSPVTSGPWMDEVKAIGPDVYAVMAPNLLHHLYLRPAKEAFPRAQLMGPRGLEAKRKNLVFDRLLEGGEADVFGTGVEVFKVAGAPKIEELIVFHGPSRSLIVTDLVFNIHRTRGWLTPWLLRLVGAYRRPAQSRLWKLSTEDKDAQKASLAPILARPFERVILAHGQVLEGGPEELAKVIGIQTQIPAAAKAG
jgi:hypothetical protein